MDDRRVRLIPLGGLGEFGLNAMVIEWEGHLLLVDAGVMFPSAETPGVDSIVPDFQYLADRADALAGIVLTHGHEDHIGAVPYLYEALKAPLYGSDFTLGLVQAKLAEHQLDARADMRPVKAREVAEIGPFQVEFLQVTHSIPASLALALRTPVGVVIHTADFKIDQSPVDGMLFDFYQDAPVSFWMKNTLIPLDMVFIAGDGTIKHVHANAVPLSTDAIPSQFPVRAVLEINGGSARLLGIKPGDKVRHAIFGNA